MGSGASDGIFERTVGGRGGRGGGHIRRLRSGSRALLTALNCRPTSPLAAPKRDANGGGNPENDSSRCAGNELDVPQGPGFFRRKRMRKHELVLLGTSHGNLRRHRPLGKPSEPSRGIDSGQFSWGVKQWVESSARTGSMIGVWGLRKWDMWGV